MAATLPPPSARRGRLSPQPEGGAPPQQRPPVPHRRWVTDLSLLLMAVIWGVNFSVVKYGTRVFAPLAFNGLRIGLGTATSFVVALAVARGERWPSPRDTLALLGLGVLGNGIYQILFIEGVARTQAGTTALLLAGTPALVAILGRLRGTERITRRGALGIACSIVGVGLVMLGGRVAGSAGGAGRDAALLGSLLVFAASACWAAYTVFLQPLSRRVNGAQLTALTLAGGCLPLLAAAARDLAATRWPASPIAVAQLAAAERGIAAGVLAFFANPWGAVAYGGLIAIGIAYILFYRGLRILGPTRTAMYVNLQPAVALFVAWLMLGEVPSSPQALGALAILTGIVLTRK